MDQSRLSLEPEVQEIMAAIDRGSNFLLSGGAGSGKTYSLVHTIGQVLQESPTASIACVTFTRAAVHEISARVLHPNLHISTIHEFLWERIGHFQKELKAVIVELLNDPDEADFSVESDEPVLADFYDHLPDGIQYKEFLKLKDGIISHDELLIVAERMFQRYPKLGSILKSTFKCVFVDEYQDTSKAVVRLLLEHLPPDGRTCVIGFFGDSMQSIYDDTVGDLSAYLVGDAPRVIEIKKPQNRRNPLSVINLANRLRTDNLSQVPSDDLTAPNMSEGRPKQGKILFLHSSSVNIDSARTFLESSQQWEINNPLKTKELNLTHNLIAEKAGFSGLMDIYDKDRILELKQTVSKRIREGGITVPDTATFGDAILLSGAAVGGNNVVGRFIADHPALFEKAKAYPYAMFRRMFVDKEQLIDDKKQSPEEESKKGTKKDALIAHLFKIERLLERYSSGRFNEFISLVEFPIKTVRDKRRLKDAIVALDGAIDQTIEDVIALADNLGLCLIDDKLSRFKRESEYVYDRVKALPYSQFRALYKYVEGFTPFSTQHKTKGREFKNVIVVLDNGKWNHYNFKSLFTGGGSENVLRRTQKIFYVCCTRAMDNLAVFYFSPDQAVIEIAKQWFGEPNVIELT